MRIYDDSRKNDRPSGLVLVTREPGEELPPELEIARFAGYGPQHYGFRVIHTHVDPDIVEVRLWND